MGIFSYNKEEIKEKVISRFGDVENYLVARKCVTKTSLLLRFLVSRFIYVMDSARTFIIVFNEKGIYEKEISNGFKGDFSLIPWHEIEDFWIDEKMDKVIIRTTHLGKKYGYEINYDGKFYKGNKERLQTLIQKNWYRVE